MSEFGADLGMVAALWLAGTFSRAAVAKKADASATARAFADLGIPHPWVAVYVTWLLEVALVILLVGWPSIGGLAAVSVLAFFTVFLYTRLRTGVTAPCGCFGAARRYPLSWADLLRNALLGAVALVATQAGERHLPSGPAVAVGGALAMAGVVAIRIARVRAARMSQHRQGRP